MGHDNARSLEPNTVKGSFQVQAIIGGDINVSNRGHFERLVRFTSELCWCRLGFIEVEDCRVMTV